MLAGDRAAEADAHAQNLSGELLRLSEGTGLFAVVQDQGVQIAVSSVKDVSHLQSVFDREALNLRQGLSKTAPRNHTILNDIVGTQPTDRREGSLSAPPDALSLLSVGRHTTLGRSRFGNDPAKQPSLFFYFEGFAFQFHNQERGGVLGIAGVYRGLSSADRQRIHDLHRRRQQT